MLVGSQSSERTRAIHLARNKDHGKAQKRAANVGPPKRDATVRSLNTLPSSTEAAARLRRKACASKPLRSLATFEAAAGKLKDRAVSRRQTVGPVMRRRAAQLGLCWNATSGLDPMSSSSAYRGLVDKHFDLYTDAMRFKFAVAFLHASKAGGTSFCALSYENDCRDPIFGNGTSGSSWRWNCWSRTHGDGPVWTTLPSKWAPGSRKDPRNGWWAVSEPSAFRSPRASSCLALEQEVLKRETTFLMNENWLPPEGLCQRFMNVALFRDPLRRFISHRNYLKVLRSPLPVQVSDFVRLAPVISNNYYVRVLAGESAFFSGLGNVTGLHLAAALDQLGALDLVLTLEALDTHGPVLIRRGLGWERNKVLGLNRRSKSRDADLPLDAKGEALWRAHNALDLQLYERAAELAELDYEFFRQVHISAEASAGAWPDEHFWKMSPSSAEDPGVDCKHTCGYACHLRVGPAEETW